MTERTTAPNWCRLSSLPSKRTMVCSSGSRCPTSTRFGMRCAARVSAPTLAEPSAASSLSVVAACAAAENIVTTTAILQTRALTFIKRLSPIIRFKMRRQPVFCATQCARRALFQASARRKNLWNTGLPALSNLFMARQQINPDELARISGAMLQAMAEARALNEAGDNGQRFWPASVRPATATIVCSRSSLPPNPRPRSTPAGSPTRWATI